jgi:Dolichyl-phosphate-mannose-protein mannosyltransferase
MASTHVVRRYVGIRERTRHLSTPIWLGILVLLAAAARFALAAQVPGPGIFPDELIYSELAKSTAASGDFAVRGTAFSGSTYGPLYVLLIAPAYRLASLPEAYLVAKAVNCLVMSLAAIPAYLLARRLVEPRWARLAAGLALLIPTMAYSSRIMTEAAAYPVFLVAVLAMIQALEQPTVRRQLAALAAIGVACAIRPQALILVPAFLTSICAQVALDARRSDRSTVRLLAGYRATGIAGLVCLAAFALIAVVEPARLGSGWNRAASIAARIRLFDVPKWLVYHLAELDVALGVVPLAAAAVLFWIVLADARGGRPAQAFAVVAGMTTAWMLLLAAVFASQSQVARVQERYLFYLEPLFLIGFLGWVTGDRRHAVRPTILAAAGAALLPLALPYGSLLNHHALASTPGLVPWIYVHAMAGTPGTIAVVAVLAVAGGLAFVHASERRSLVTPVVVYLAVCTLLVSGATQATSQRSLRAGGAAADRAWIDHAVGRHADVVALWSATGERWTRFRRIWENEFFNRSLGAVYYLRAPLAYGLPETRIRRLGKALVLPSGRPLRAQYVLSDGPGIRGTPVAARPDVHLTLYRVDGTVRLAR